LAAALPSPRRSTPARPSAYLRRRARVILTRMEARGWLPPEASQAYRQQLTTGGEAAAGTEIDEDMGPEAESEADGEADGEIGLDGSEPGPELGTGGDTSLDPAGQAEAETGVGPDAGDPSPVDSVEAEVGPSAAPPTESTGESAP
jgi:membrane peptidoglycan carboxypeptidase